MCVVGIQIHSFACGYPVVPARFVELSWSPSALRGNSVGNVLDILWYSIYRNSSKGLVLKTILDGVWILSTVLHRGFGVVEQGWWKCKACLFFPGGQPDLLLVIYAPVLSVIYLKSIKPLSPDTWHTHMYFCIMDLVILNICWMSFCKIT